MKMNQGIALITMAAFLTGCASMSDSEKTTAQGAGVGAGLGAMIGGIIGHQSGSGLEGAAIGGLVGAAAGGLYGNHVAGKKEEYASQEDYIDACIGQAEEVHQLASGYNEQLRTEIAELDQKSSDLVASYEKQEAEKAELVAMQEDMAVRLKDAEESLAAITDEIKIQEGVLKKERGEASEEQLAKLEETIRMLEEQKAELAEHTDRLASINNRISV